MIGMRIAYTGIEIISIPVYAHVAMRIQIILYALPVVTLTQAYKIIVNRPLGLSIACFNHLQSQNRGVLINCISVKINVGIE